MLTVHDLRKRGYKVKVRHDRDVALYSNYDWDRTLAVGRTEVYIESPDGNRCSNGVAYRSIKEQFNRKRGLRIALGRALKNLGMCTK